MGMVVEGASKGTLQLKKCLDGAPFGFAEIMREYPGVKFFDVGGLLVRLATAGADDRCALACLEMRPDASHPLTSRHINRPGVGGTNGSTL